LYAVITAANFTNSSTIASSAFNRAAVIQLGTALTLRQVPMTDRTLLVWPNAMQTLLTDSAVVSLATYRTPELITQPYKENAPEELVIPIDTFGRIINAANLPANNINLNA